MSGRHCILVVEDDAENAATLRDAVCSMDMDCRVVARLDEVRALLESGFVPCGVLQDMQIPHGPNARPHEKAGESSILMVRARWSGKGRVPIIVVTAFRHDPDFVWRMSELDADGFVHKSSLQSLPDKLIGALEKQGRGDHARCAGCSAASWVGGGEGEDTAVAQAAPAASAAPVVAKGSAVTLAIGGATSAGRNVVHVCGGKRELTDAPFALLLRLAAAHERRADLWSDKTELNIGEEDRAVVTRVRGAFRGLVPEVFVAIENDRRGQFRLNPEVVVAPIDWDALGAHPVPAVRRIAGEAGKKKTGARDGER